MAKTKPNQPCPCNSGKKYKKCCFSEDIAKKNAFQKEFEDLITVAEETPITDEWVLRTNNMILDRYRTPSVDMTRVVNNENLSKVHEAYKKRKICIIVRRNESSESAFKLKRAAEEDMMLIYQNNFLLFRYEEEFNEAMDEITKWFSKQRIGHGK